MIPKFQNIMDVVITAMRKCKAKKGLFIDRIDT